MASANCRSASPAPAARVEQPRYAAMGRMGRGGRAPPRVRRPKAESGSTPPSRCLPGAPERPSRCAPPLAQPQPQSTRRLRFMSGASSACTDRATSHHRRIAVPGCPRGGRRVRRRQRKGADAPLRSVTSRRVHHSRRRSDVRSGPAAGAASDRGRGLRFAGLQPTRPEPFRPRRVERQVEAPVEEAVVEVGGLVLLPGEEEEVAPVGRVGREFGHEHPVVGGAGGQSQSGEAPGAPGLAREWDRLSTEFRLAEVGGLAFHEPRPDGADRLLVAEHRDEPELVGVTRAAVDRGAESACADGEQLHQPLPREATTTGSVAGTLSRVSSPPSSSVGGMTGRFALSGGS